MVFTDVLRLHVCFGTLIIIFMLKTSITSEFLNTYSLKKNIIISRTVNTRLSLIRVTRCTKAAHCPLRSMNYSSLRETIPKQLKNIFW